MAGRHRRRHPRRLAALVTGAALLFTGVGVGLAFGVSSRPASRGPRAINVQGAATPNTTGTAPAATPTASPSRTPSAPSASHSPSARPTGGVTTGANRFRRATFAVRVIGPACWVRVAVPGGAVLFTGTLVHGQARTFGAPAVAVTLGNAGAAEIWADGVRHPVAGPRGIVVTFTVVRH